MNLIASTNEAGHNTPSGTSDSIASGCVCKDIENLSIIANLTKFKRPNLIKYKKAKNLESVIANSFKTDITSYTYKSSLTKY